MGKKKQKKNITGLQNQPKTASHVKDNDTVFMAPAHPVTHVENYPLERGIENSNKTYRILKEFNLVYDYVGM